MVLFSCMFTVTGDALRTRHCGSAGSTTATPMLNVYGGSDGVVLSIYFYYLDWLKLAPGGSERKERE